MAFSFKYKKVYVLDLKWTSIDIDICYETLFIHCGNLDQSRPGNLDQSRPDPNIKFSLIGNFSFGYREC